MKQQYSKKETGQLNEHYSNNFSWTPEARQSLVTSLNITGVKEWIRRKREKEKALKRTKNLLQRAYKREHGIHFAGVLACYFVVVLLTQFT